MSTPARIVFYGVAGAGKTTLAARVAERLQIPLTSADSLFWRPGWVKVDVAEQRRLMGAVFAQDRWVVDSAWSSVRTETLERADLLVCLDYPWWLTGSRLLRRTVRRVVTKEHVCNGNVESLRTMLWGREAILVWWLRTVRSRHRSIARLAHLPHPDVVVLRRPADAEEWLATLGG